MRPSISFQRQCFLSWINFDTVLQSNLPEMFFCRCEGRRQNKLGPETEMPEKPPSPPDRRPHVVVRDALSEGYDHLRSYLVRRLGNAAEADDVLQGAILRAIKKAPDLRNEHAVRGWLARIISSTIVDHQRREASRRRNEREFSLHNPSFSTDEDIDTAVCDCIHLILPTLKSEYSEVIRRPDLEGRDRVEVAAALGVTTNALTVRLYRARSDLRRRLMEMSVSCKEQSFLQCSC
jgi:RNA polymerase sigma factor (sigma-70 family)